MIDRTFWQNKKVFITGHTGFKGAWLSLWLQTMNAKVTGIAMPAEHSKQLFTVANIADHMNHVEGNILDHENLSQLIHAEKPEIVFHMAAQSLVRKGYQDPINTYMVNLMGTVQLFEILKNCHSVRAIVNVTSDKCYAVSATPKPYIESDYLGGNDPYSSSKACAEIISNAYRSSIFKNNIAMATVRSGNVIGGGDWAEDRLIPDMVRASQNSQPLIVRYPKAVRPWLHVLDSLRGYLLLAAKLYQQDSEYATAWNFGSSPAHAKSVEWMIDAARKNGLSMDVTFEDESAWPEAAYLSLNSDKAKSLLNWQPVWQLEAALKHTINWYLALANKQKMRDFSIAQIKEYEYGS